MAQGLCDVIHCGPESVMSSIVCLAISLLLVLYQPLLSSNGRILKLLLMLAFRFQFKVRFYVPTAIEDTGSPPIAGYCSWSNFWTRFIIASVIHSPGDNGAWRSDTYVARGTFDPSFTTCSSVQSIKADSHGYNSLLSGFPNPLLS